MMNLALRFVLEMIALAVVGYWGWYRGDSIWQYVFAIMIPATLATIWAVFRVPNDPGSAPVAVPGVVRLAIEATFFTLAILALRDTGYRTAALVLAVTLVIHYAVDYERLRWLVRQ